MSDDLTPARLDEIEEVARVALSGSPQGWTAHQGENTFDYYIEDDGLYLGACPDCGVRASFLKEEAIYIDTFDPPTALALVAEVRELRAKVERVRESPRPSESEPRRCVVCGEAWPCKTTRIVRGEE